MIDITAKKFKKGDIVRLKDECKDNTWYWDVEYEVYDYAYMQMIEVESGNICDVLERTYYTDTAYYEFESFEGWVVLVRSVGEKIMDIEFKTYSEDFIEMCSNKINRQHKINQIIYES